MKLTIEHVSEHPRRDELRGVGGIPLSKTRLVYAQFVTPSDPADPTKRMEPYTAGLPRIYGGVVYNGGTPWGEGFDRALMLRAFALTSARFWIQEDEQRTDSLILDFEPQWLDDPTKLTPAQFAEAMRCLYDCGRYFNGLWGFPRWDWKLSPEQLEHVRRVVRGVTTLHLDGYWCAGWGEGKAIRKIDSLANLVFEIGRAPSECVLNHRPVKNLDPNAAPLTAGELRTAIKAGMDRGFTHQAVWHDGDEWAKPGDAKTVGPGGFEATKALCGRDDIAGVIREFTA